LRFVRWGGSGALGAHRIRTARLELVPLAVSDAEEMVTVLGDERLYAFTGGHPPALAELRARYARLVAGRSPDGTKQWRNWIVRLRDGRAVGTVQATITAAGRAAEVAWVIGVTWQGLGLASEAAGGLVAWLEAGGVQTITAHVHPDHHASAAVAARAGLAATGEVHDGEQVWRRPARRPPRPIPRRSRPLPRRPG
jgi:RimJ/RimL family protein N-acetyltransferase